MGDAAIRVIRSSQFELESRFSETQTRFFCQRMTEYTQLISVGLIQESLSATTNFWTKNGIYLALTYKRVDYDFKWSKCMVR